MVLGTEREWRVKNGQLKLQEVNHHGYVIDFLSSLKVSVSFKPYVHRCRGSISNM